MGYGRMAFVMGVMGMIIGQSAGVAAALAAGDGTSVQELPYERLRECLVAQKQVLELPEVSELAPTGDSIDPTGLSEIVLDDRRATLTGDWSRSTQFKPHVGSGYVFCGEEGSGTRGDGKSSATFRFEVPQSGRCQVSMAYSAHESRASEVPVVVASGSYKKRFSIGQTQPPASGQQFKSVGSVELESGVEVVITISNTDSAGFVIVDALQLVPVLR